MIKYYKGDNRLTAILDGKEFMQFEATHSEVTLSLGKNLAYCAFCEQNQQEITKEEYQDTVDDHLGLYEEVFNRFSTDSHD